MYKMEEVTKDVQLDGVLYKLLPNTYLGTFPLNKLPANASPPFCFIVNTDNDYRDGTHWMAVHILNCNKAIFIEPLGMPLHLLRFSTPLNTFLTGHSLYTETLPFQVQPSYSQACGQFCAYILYHLPMYDYSLTKLAQREFLADDLDFNVNQVTKWFNQF